MEDLQLHLYQELHFHAAALPFLGSHATALARSHAAPAPRAFATGLDTEANKLFSSAATLSARKMS